VTKNIARISFGLFAAACVIATTAVAQGNSATSAKTSASSSATKPATATAITKSHETVEYKDPEDMTTRYRPGNNKTSSAESPATTTASGEPASDADAKKHVANIKWSDRTASLPACDGASKDAAKCAVAPGAGKTAASDEAGQKH
jgi:hypothetical protein